MIIIINYIKFFKKFLDGKHSSNLEESLSFWNETFKNEKDFLKLEGSVPK